jgi:hypothetical protein
MKTEIISTGIFLGIVGLFAGISFSIDWTPKTIAEDPFEAELNKISKNQERMLQSIPIPELQTSSERKNVAKRAEIFNNEEKISYIYLVSYGKIMAFYTVKGKVSSLQSYLAPLEQMVDYRGRKCDGSWSNSCNSSEGSYIVSAPDIDGTYGENVEGIFFFTTEGAYVEWKGDYMMSDQPLKLSQEPMLIREVE